MNASDVIHNGHQTLMTAVATVPHDAWERPGVCGDWSAKQVVAHLASFECLLVEVLAAFLADEPTPMLARFLADRQAFNQVEVAHRKDQTPAAIVQEYETCHTRAVQQMARIPPEMCWQNGTLPWYGQTHDLDDFIVYCVYGHKREHSAQLMACKNRLSRHHP